MRARPDLLSDTRTVSAEALAQPPHAAAMTLEEALPLLISPDSGMALRMDGGMLSDGTHRYPLRGEAAVLLPERLQAHFTDRLAVPPAYGYDAFLQYFLLASIKQSGETNAAPDNEHYQRHLFRMRALCASASGLVLDVGCDDPRIGAALLPEGARYIGLDPCCMQPSPFRLIGVGEYLPLRSDALDGVLFNTSLDHILDWRRALHEAARTLKRGGMLYMSTLVWAERADLASDSVHFHHFREYEILGGLEEAGFVPVHTSRYDYKGDTHRYGLYLTARKR